MNKNFLVWEPKIEGPEHASIIEAQTPGQAAFLAASARNIGFRSADYVVSDGKRRVNVKIEPKVWYQVGSVSEPYEPPGEVSADAS